MTEYGIRHVYPWKYTVWVGDAHQRGHHRDQHGEQRVFVSCYRHSGPVSKYTRFNFPVEELITNTIEDKVRKHIVSWAEEHGA